MNRLFVLAYDNRENGNNRVERNSHQKYSLPRINITKYNVLIDGRKFYDQSIFDQTRKYDALRTITIVKGENYTVGYLLDYKYFKYHYQVICYDLSNQQQLDVDPRAIQQV